VRTRLRRRVRREGRHLDTLSIRHRTSTRHLRRLGWIRARRRAVRERHSSQPKWGLSRSGRKIWPSKRLLPDCEFDPAELPSGEFKGADDTVAYRLRHTVEHPCLANLAVHLLLLRFSLLLTNDCSRTKTQLCNRLLLERYHKNGADHDDDEDPP
jgi:hypothetical protein